MGIIAVLNQLLELLWFIDRIALSAPEWKDNAVMLLLINVDQINIVIGIRCSLTRCLSLVAKWNVVFSDCIDIFVSLLIILWQVAECRLITVQKA